VKVKRHRPGLTKPRRRPSWVWVWGLIQHVDPFEQRWPVTCVIPLRSVAEEQLRQTIAEEEARGRLVLEVETTFGHGRPYGWGCAAACSKRC
jgi:hypothetical protein